ncbi:MAG TPA: DUF86 domain-containing protein [Thermoplasmataceae archaeon]|nr:DUF86 domain-containing protein [Thermoplasmataceae archaeon]
MSAREVRDTLIYTKITEAEESVEAIREHLPEEVEDFIKLGIVKDGIYKRAEYAIENVFDICHIINSDLSLGIPSSEEDVIENLRKNGIFDDNIASKVLSMRKFRNIVVHRYGKIDDSIAYNLLTEELDDFSIFVEWIRKFLKER